ncbi:MAG: hypothetical protein ACTSO9_15575 [Candidatus Helarchaeota archaeon]
MELEDFAQSLSKTELFQILLSLSEKINDLEKKIYDLEIDLESKK